MSLTPTLAGRLWCAWSMLILFVGILPLHNFVGHAHWQYIRWVPSPDQLSSPDILLDLGFDAIANILLFVPFGLLYTLRGLGGRSISPSLLMLMAFALSFGIEYYQVYCHNRSTSLLDLLDNVLGAYIGMKVGEACVRRNIAVAAEPAS